MKWVLFLLSFLGWTLSAADLSGIRSVYFLPMSNGLDQYLANRLTNAHLFQVVTDPKRADAVFTDRIGEPLEDRLGQWYSPEARPAKDKEKDKEKEKDKSAASAKAGDTPDKAVITPSFGHGKGTVFLVDAKTRQVLWSLYEQPKDVSAKQLDRTAGRIVDHLKKDISGK